MKHLYYQKVYQIPTGRLTGMHAAVILLLFVPLLHSCTACSRQSVPIASLKMELKDPLVLRTLGATQDVSIVARAVLNSGQYQYRNHTLSIAQETIVTMDVVLPVKGSSELDAGSLNGQIDLTQPVTVDGVELPKSIQFKNHTATASIDFGSMFLSVIVNSLMNFAGHDAGSHAEARSLANAIKALSLQKACFTLLPEHNVNFGGIHLIPGPNASVVFEHVEYSSPTEYSGSCAVNLPEARSIKFHSENGDLSARNMNAKIAAMAVCQKGQLTVESSKETPGTFVLRDCKLENANSNLQIAEFVLKPSHFKVVSGGDRGLAWQKAALAMDGVAQADHTQLTLQSEEHELTAEIPSFLGNFSVSNGGAKRNPTINISVPGTVQATDVACSWHKGSRNVHMKLSAVQLQGLNVSQPKNVAISGTGGEFILSELELLNAKTAVSLKPRSRNAAKIKFIQGFTFDKVGNAAMKALVTVGPGRLQIKSGFDGLLLDNAQGTLVAATSGDVASLTGKFAAMIKPLGGAKVPSGNVNLRSLSLQQSGSKLVLNLRDCHLLMTDQSLRATIASSLPKQKVVSLHKVLSNSLPLGRYKNLTLEQVVVSNPTISNVHCSVPNTAKADCRADVLLSGTVEQCHPIASLLHRDTAPTVKKWSARANVSGEADINFKLNPGKTISDTNLHLDVHFITTRLNKADIDWSKVSSGLLGKLEQAAMAGVLKVLQSYALQKGLPALHAQADIRLGNHAPQLRASVLRSLQIRPALTGVDLVFDADLNL